MSRIKGRHGGSRIGAGRKRGGLPKRIGKSTGKHGGPRRGSGRIGHKPRSEDWSLYIIREGKDSDHEVCKVGITSISPKSRLNALQVGNWRILSLGAVVDLHSEDEALRVETIVHKKLGASRVGGEWFRVTLKIALTALGEAMVEAAIELEGPKQKALFD